ncbi:MAG: hypothetical protein KAH18_01975 [Psychromonas sp.]|nr:hypothetical protein [Psychromonas sp.]
MLTVCKGTNSLKKSTQNQSDEETDLLGTWITQCTQSAGIRGYPKGYHYIKNYHFYSNNVEVVFILYRDSDPGGDMCSIIGPAMSAKFTADITFDKVIDKGSIEVHTDLNIINRKVMFAPQSQYVADLFNSGKALGEIYSGYGMTDWAVRVYKDVTGIKDANKNFNIGTMVPDIFQISEIKIIDTMTKVLRMGDKQGALDQYGRPEMLQKRYAKYQKPYDRSSKSVK